MSSTRYLPLALLLVACTKSPPRTDAVPGTSSGGPASSSPPRAVASVAKAPSPPVAVKAKWSFWAKDGALVVASRTDLYRLDLTCAATSQVATKIDDLYAENGQNVFVIRSGDTYERWDATTLTSLGALEHHAPDAGSIPVETAAFSREHIALGHELFKASTGERIGPFSAKWIEHLSFSDDGKYLIAKGQSSGLWIFASATAKLIVTRPKWSAIQEVHGWNRPDIAQVIGDELVVSGGDTVEHIDLTTGKTLGKVTASGRTASVYAPRSRRVTLFEGQRSRLRVWDVGTHTFVGTFELGKAIESGANCTHCSVEFDELDEDKLWLLSAYTNDKLVMRISTGAVDRVEQHEFLATTTPSKTHRVAPVHTTNGKTTCFLERRDADAGARIALPLAFCEPSRGYGENNQWPYPGFDPSGRTLATIDAKEQLSVWDVERGNAACATR